MVLQSRAENQSYSNAPPPLPNAIVLLETAVKSDHPNHALLIPQVLGHLPQAGSHARRGSEHKQLLTQWPPQEQRTRGHGR